MSRDTANHRYLELVRKKLYYLYKIQDVLYRLKPSTIYVFGNGDSDAESRYLLFYDSTNYSHFFVVGDEGSLVESMRNLRDKLYDTSKITGENVNECYSSLLVNWESPWVFHVMDKPKQN